MIEELKEFVDKKFIIGVITSVIVTFILTFLGVKGKNFMIYYGEGSVEMHDQCLDTLNNADLLDKSTFKPKKPRYIVIHTTGSKKDQTQAELMNVFIQRWGKYTKPGYNYAVNMKGEVYYLAPIDNSPLLEWNEVVYGVKNYNSVTINIAYTGGYHGDSRTESQINTIKILVKHIKTIFPDIIVVGHRDMPNVAKTCPNFDVKSEFTD